MFWVVVKCVSVRMLVCLITVSVSMFIQLDCLCFVFVQLTVCVNTRILVWVGQFLSVFWFSWTVCVNILISGHSNSRSAGEEIPRFFKLNSTFISMCRKGRRLKQTQAAVKWRATKRRHFVVLCVARLLQRCTH
jgi:hypothetical protein